MNVLKKHWPWALSVLGGLVAFLDPSVRQYAGDHAQYTTTIITLWSVLSHLLQSPIQPKS